MDVSNLLSREPSERMTAAPSALPHVHPYPTRQAVASQAHTAPPDRRATPSMPRDDLDPSTSSVSSLDRTPAGQTTEPKLVAFELRFPEAPEHRARLPMRVNIHPHDTTDSIITTVKNFYGLYEGPGGVRGVTFEDDRANTLIARYENFDHGMTVIVRVVLEPAVPPYHATRRPRWPTASPGPRPYLLPSGFAHHQEAERIAPCQSSVSSGCRRSQHPRLQASRVRLGPEASWTLSLASRASVGHGRGRSPCR